MYVAIKLKKTSNGGIVVFIINTVVCHFNDLEIKFVSSM